MHVVEPAARGERVILRSIFPHACENRRPNAIDDANYTQINLLALPIGLRRLLRLAPRLPLLKALARGLLLASLGE